MSQIIQIFPGWYDTASAAKLLGNITRAAVGKIARTEGWDSRPGAPGTTHLHRADDVHQYRDHQVRTELVTALGWKGRGLYRVSDVDISCPVCDASAIEWPAPPYLAEKFICVKGHKGELCTNSK